MFEDFMAGTFVLIILLTSVIVISNAHHFREEYTGYDLAQKLPKCPTDGISSYEKVAGLRYNVTDIRQAFAMNNWTNISVVKHVSNGYFDESYSKVRAECKVS